MKRALIGDSRNELITTLESLLKNWGYRAIAAVNPDSFLEMHKELKPDLLILGPTLLADKKTADQIQKIQTPCIHIEDPEAKPDWKPKGDLLSYPVDVFNLFSLVQGYLEKIPRRNIRLNVRMPSLYYKETGACIAEVLSLSPEGLFLKTGSKLEEVDDIRLVLPLIGMQTELEILGRIVYRVEPTPENNYMQGMGIEFADMNEKTARTLDQYVEGLLFEELNERQYSRTALNTDHLLKHGDEPVLQLIPNN